MQLFALQFTVNAGVVSADAAQSGVQALVDALQTDPCSYGMCVATSTVCTTCTVVAATASQGTTTSLTSPGPSPSEHEVMGFRHAWQHGAISAQ